MWIKYRRAYNPVTTIWLLDPEIKLFSGDIGVLHRNNLNEKTGGSGALYLITRDLLDLPRVENVSLYDWPRGRELMLSLAATLDDNLADPELFDRHYGETWEKIIPRVREILSKHLPGEIEFINEGYSHEKWSS